MVLRIDLAPPEDFDFALSARLEEVVEDATEEDATHHVPVSEESLLAASQAKR